MKIRLDEITQEGLDFNITDNPEAFNFEEADCVFKFPITATGKATKSGNNIYVGGTLKTKVGLECSRCLTSFNFEIEDSFNILYEPKPPHKNFKEEIELSEEDLDINYYEGDSIDLQEIIRQQLLLAIPIKSLCKDACRGLCPKCGINLNLEECQCKKKEVDPRLNALKDYFTSEK
ncbi:MAG: DUF177 domain-containing protein [bacterium]